MEKGLSKLYLGDFNTMKQDHLPDGSVVITLSSEGDPAKYRFKVKDLYGKNEKVLEHEILMPESKPWLEKRQKQANK